MAHPPRILAFAGSLRGGSFNKKLARLAAEAARKAGGEVTVVDLADYPLPLFDEDLETAQGSPPNAHLLKQLFVDHQGFLMACPEYNSSVTAVWKNVIDWVSRPAPGEPPLIAFAGKVATLMSASPGALGGLRGLVHARTILTNLNVIVLPGQLAVSRAHEAFDDHGGLRDPARQATVEKLAAGLVGMIGKITA